MALRSLWGRLTGRDTPAETPPPADAAPPPAATPAGIPPLLAEAIAPPPLPAVPAPPAPPPEAEPEPAPAQTGGGWFSRLKAGLSRSTARLTDAITTVFRKRRLDDAALEELEETLIAADLGLPAAQRIVGEFRRTRFGREVTDEEVKAALAESIAQILAPVATPMPIEPAHAPHVVLVVGVNGTGKTTTIAKLSKQYRDAGHQVMLAAGDTFRAAAVEQLQIWGERTGAPVVLPSRPGADAAGLAHDALARAKAEGMDVLLIDTAGRLHNKAALMEELRKIIRVIRKLDPTAPHSVLLTLDATTGQNALSQVRIFRDMVEVSGLAVTKLDGSAKGGVVVALAQEFGLPVHFVGVGEKADDLRPFEARDFARGLVGLD
jgi:fused signal recognition particle receptor